MLKENISRKGFKDLSRRAMSQDREVKASSGGPLEAVSIEPSHSTRGKKCYSNFPKLTGKPGGNWLVGVGVSPQLSHTMRQPQGSPSFAHSCMCTAPFPRADCLPPWPHSRWVPAPRERATASALVAQCFLVVSRRLPGRRRSGRNGAISTTTRKQEKASAGCL